MTKRELFLSPLLLLVAFANAAVCQQRTIPVKVVVLAMFEVGADAGDAPGELQYWVERDHLDRIYPLPAGYHAVRMNDQGEMAVLTGQGTAHAASTVMAVGLDPRFDFSHAYWIVAGIAGGCPDQVSLGSAVWARWIVDGDLGYEIDAREIPQDWSTGYLPLRKKLPFETPADPLDGQAYKLNAGLANWAFNLTSATPLDDSDKLKEIRSHFDGAAAQRPPSVAMGDEISSSTYFHGKLMDAWAAQWVPYFTGGKGVFATTAMEDTGTLQSIEFLARAGRVDINRVLVLRAVSNYDRQPVGLSASESLARQRIGAYAAYLPALEAAYRVGHEVVSELLAHWTRYEGTIPTTEPTPAKQ
jgi:purine nucleoside permease